MIRPLAIATDGLLDERYLPGIATRGYLWESAVAAYLLLPAALEQAVTVQPPSLRQQRSGVVYASAGWADQPAAFARFAEDKRVSANLTADPRPLARMAADARASALWTGNKFVIARVEGEVNVTATAVELDQVFILADEKTS